ncbi:uncharacterized protein E0L32_010313 [Thyridium curvatum]|uniref:C2H2-type domain-containing protein n=1 Tax=Thyridium curvatum TaxID=1093900 RepID=A0A507AGL9_9PEZI|nr:uncharacterized protein E0L32_010313 [Thyridium curvatum]TPX07982.1 hypothetical protein E0L32_010313 [Thyridium curvatum]
MSSPQDGVAEEVVVQPPPREAKRFQCPRCQRSFSRLEHLQRHDRTHTQERPFACHLCTSRFTRSDLLIRHERLSHNKDKRRESGHAVRPRKSARRPENASAGRESREQDLTGEVERSQHESVEVTQAFVDVTPGVGVHEYQSPLETLSLAAEQSAFHDGLVTSAPSQPFHGNIPHAAGFAAPMAVLGTEAAPILGDLDVSFDSFAAFLETEALSNNLFPSSMATNEQPMPLFPFANFPNVNETYYNPGVPNVPAFAAQTQNPVEEQTSFSRFGSRLPSLQPEDDPCKHARKVCDISSEDRDLILSKISQFPGIVSRYFHLPTRMSLARYIRAYIDGFQEHLPFLHIPSMTVDNSAVEVLLAMAAVGAQYCFEAEKGLELFHVARAIATERIRQRDVKIASVHRSVEQDASDYSVTSAVSSPALTHPLNGPLGLPSDPGSAATTTSAPADDLMQSAQALLILMAMATWAKHKEILREALSIQSVLASIVRDDGLRIPQSDDQRCQSWEEWARQETVLRTKYIVFCFFNLHSIVYDIPPLLLNSEIDMVLPSGSAEFKAGSATRWEEAMARADKPCLFQDALRWLFTSDDNQYMLGCHSSLGNYVLIHAIIQHIFMVRQTARCRFVSPELEVDDVAPLEQALRRWQLSWKSSPESSIDPVDPNGPVAFNSTALLRLAYIRLNMDTGPGRALGTRDPVQIAHALRDMPAIRRTPKLVRALLHSAHALSIPVKIGVRLVAKTQAFIWSIQHSLCSLECALVLSKWLEAVGNPNPPISDDERKILSIVKTMLDETEFGVPPGSSIDSPETAQALNAG